MFSALPIGAKYANSSPSGLTVTDVISGQAKSCRRDIRSDTRVLAQRPVVGSHGALWVRR